MTPGRSDLAKRWQASARKWVGVNLVLLVVLIAMSAFMGQVRQGYVKQAADAARVVETNAKP